MFRQTASILVMCGLAVALASSGQAPPAEVIAAAPVRFEAPPLLDATPAPATVEVSQRTTEPTQDATLARIESLENQLREIRKLLDERTLMPSRQAPLYTQPQPAQQPKPAAVPVESCGPGGCGNGGGIFRGRGLFGRRR